MSCCCETTGRRMNLDAFYEALLEGVEEATRKFKKRNNYLALAFSIFYVLRHYRTGWNSWI